MARGGGGGSRMASRLGRGLLLSSAGGLAALVVAAVAAADVVVSTDAQLNGLLELTGAGGNNGVIIEPFLITSPGGGRAIGTRVRQLALGDPTIRGASGVDCTTNPIFNDVVCRGDPGRVTVTMGDGSDRVHLREIPPDTTAGCVDNPRTWSVTVNLGAGSDTQTAGFAPIAACTNGALEVARAMFLTANGGSGNDVLTGTALGSTLNGGAGRDELGGSSRANDTLDGGSGADVMSGGSSNADDFDTATYASRTERVTVSLDGVANDGESGEGDNVFTSVERVLGGNGSDALVAFGGRQTLVGNGGADELSGGDDRDTFLGGDGDDFVQTRDGVPEVPDCGRGVRDSVLIDLFDIPRLCEFVDRSPVDDGLPGHALRQPLQRRADGTVVVGIACPRAARIACAGTLTLRRAGGRGVLARGRYRAAVGKTVSVTLRVRGRLPGQVRAETLEQGLSKKGPRSSSYLLSVR